MQQLIQKLGSGVIIIQDVPYTQLGKGMVIVKNNYCIINPGSDGYIPLVARRILIGLAKGRLQQVKYLILRYAF